MENITSDQPTIRLWGQGAARTMQPIWLAEELNLNYELVAMGPRTGESKSLALAAIASSAAYFHRALSVVEDHLIENEYVMGRSIGLADMLLVTCLDMAIYFDLSLPVLTCR